MRPHSLGKKFMIIVTGAAGFIGSCVVAGLNAEGYRDLILVDDFSRENRAANYAEKSYTAKVERNHFFEWITGKEASVQAILHLGARTDTAEMDTELFDRLNLHYTQRIWNLCTAHQVPLIYASSAATYGDGALGFSDADQWAEQLHPLNPYGHSKNEFDKWALKQPEKPFFWAGLKFFNVYGPNEYHKGRMASVVFHTFHQIKKSGKMRLFRSHRPNFADGEQQRDFIYVKDVVSVILFLLHHRKDAGIYNLGTGKARTFRDLAEAVFRSQNLEPAIEFMDTPLDIRDTYQYYTQAEMTKLEAIGYTQPFTDLETGISEYVQGYLLEEKYY